jgi:hypothetical protein
VGWEYNRKEGGTRVWWDYSHDFVRTKRGWAGKKNHCLRITPHWGSSTFPPFSPLCYVLSPFSTAVCNSLEYLVRTSLLAEEGAIKYNHKLNPSQRNSVNYCPCFYTWPFSAECTVDLVESTEIQIIGSVWFITGLKNAVATTAALLLPVLRLSSHAKSTGQV